MDLSVRWSTSTSIYILVLVLCWNLGDGARNAKDHTFQGAKEFDLPVDMEDDKGFNFAQEKGGDYTTNPSLEFIEADSDEKLLGIPWYEYLTVGLVVVFAAGTGGGVVIMCRKCGGIFGKRRSKEEKVESNPATQGAISLITVE